jgi:hypothetical protein
VKDIAVRWAKFVAWNSAKYFPADKLGGDHDRRVKASVRRMKLTLIRNSCFKVEILSLFFCHGVPVVNLWRVHCAPISVRAGYSAAVSEILF